jgi:putative hydrolase of the HAD superfamily
MISADINMGKPNSNFFDKLVFDLNESPENILFVDDDKINIEAAKNMRIQTLHYDRSKDLVDEVLNKLQ